jgi:hypothetical protein
MAVRLCSNQRSIPVETLDPKELRRASIPSTIKTIARITVWMRIEVF